MTLFNEGCLRDTTVGSDDGLPQQSQEALSPAVANPAPQASTTGSCPIEDAMISLGYGNNADISLFTSWASERKPTRIDSLGQFGGLRDVRLYRSRKKPFNHEYILFRFLNVSGVESWLRLERAARLGRHPYVPRPANFEPLTTGIAAKDTVSFSTAHGPLSSNSDEVAAVSLSPPLYPSAPQILLEDLAQIIFRTKATNPLYQLFTVNCRWFARRLYLTVIQWCQSANIAHEITWRGVPSNYSLASQKLQKEWFGGAHLEGDKGMRLRLEHLLALAVQLLDCGDALVARSVCEDALDTIERLTNGSEMGSFLLSYALVTLGDAIVMMGEPFAALPQLQRACDVVRPLVDTRKHLYAHALARYAHALCACGRVPEACTMQGEAIDLTRTLRTLDFEPVRDLLSLRLHDLGTYQVILKQYDAACVSFEEAITIRNILHASHPSRYLQPLLATLSHYADALNSCSRSHEAIGVSGKAVSLTRLAYSANPEDIRQELAGQLYNLAQYLRHSDDPEALSTAKEALDLRRKMCETAPGQHRLSLLSSLQQCATICSDLCDAETARAYCKEAVEILRELRREDKDDITLRDQLSTTLCNAAYCLAAMEDSQAAADCFREAVELDREGYIADPAKCCDRLVETLLEYAEHLESMERIDEVSQVRSELERIRSQ